MRHSWFLLTWQKPVAQEATCRDRDELQEKAIRTPFIKSHFCRESKPWAAPTSFRKGRRRNHSQGAGPTSGLIVRRGWLDHHRRRFNFAKKPTDDRERSRAEGRFVAKVIATDHSRSLTLLKIDARTCLPTPARRRDQGRPLVAGAGRHLGGAASGNRRRSSLGIISRRRIGARQPDRREGVAGELRRPARRSQGRVQGVLVPLSPGSGRRPAGVVRLGIISPFRWKTSTMCWNELKLGRTSGRGCSAFRCKTRTFTACHPPSARSFAGGSGQPEQGDVIIENRRPPGQTKAQVLHQLGSRL